MTEQEARAIAIAQVPTTDSPLTLSALERYLAAAADGHATKTVLRPTGAGLRNAGMRGSQRPPKMED